MRSDISSSPQTGTTQRYANTSTCIIRCCQPTTCAGHLHSPLPCSGTSRSRSSGRECRFTHSRTLIDGEPAKAVGCRAGIETCSRSQTPSYSIYPSHGEELTVCNSSLSLFSSLNEIPTSCPTSGTAYCGHCLSDSFQSVNPKTRFPTGANNLVVAVSMLMQRIRIIPRCLDFPGRHETLTSRLLSNLAPRTVSSFLTPIVFALETARAVLSLNEHSLLALRHRPLVHPRLDWRLPVALQKVTSPESKSVGSVANLYGHGNI